MSLLSGDELEKIKQDLKGQILQEIKDEKQKQLEALEAQRKQERTEHEKFVTLMKESKDPWVEVIGWTHTEDGVKVELEWNDAFVLYLRDNGVTGSDDDQIVQRWVTLLLRDMADKMDEQT